MAAEAAAAAATHVVCEASASYAQACRAAKQSEDPALTKAVRGTQDLAKASVIEVGQSHSRALHGDQSSAGCARQRSQHHLTTNHSQPGHAESRHCSCNTWPRALRASRA